MQHDLPNTGIVLSGGGARAAYQVGVLKAIYEMTPKGSLHPFPIICGSSAGAINAAVIACYAGQYRAGLRRLEGIWTNLTVNQVFRGDTLGLLKQSLGFTWHILSGRNPRKHNALLDNAPLRKLLEKSIPFKRLDKLIDEGLLQALCISCSDYYSGDTYSYYQGHDDIRPWKRHRRLGVADNIQLDHLMASSAIPLIFPSVAVGSQYLGDGSVGFMSPISPAIHLGAEKIMIIGLDPIQSEPGNIIEDKPHPGFSDVAGHVLDSVFIDSLNSDLERLQRINQTLKSVPSELMEKVNLPLKSIEALVIAPSIELGELATNCGQQLPRATRFFLSRIGIDCDSGSNMLSYLLFDGQFCKKLIELGYQDTQDRASEVMDFFELER